MAGCSCTGCLNDIEPADLREQHTDDGHIRHDCRNLVLHALIALGLEEIRHEARAIVAVDLEYPVLYLPGYRAGGIHRKVSAFGVTADDKRSVIGLGRPLKICLCVKLRGHDLLDGKLAVFLPADYRIVCSSEGNILHAVGRKHRQCRKLLGFFDHYFVNEARELYVSESVGQRDFSEHGERTRRGNQPQLITDILAGGKVAADRLVDGHGFTVGGNYPREIGLADAGENVLIYLVDRHGIKAQIAAPIHIIQCVCHNALPSEVFFIIA